VLYLASDYDNIQEENKRVQRNPLTDQWPHLLERFLMLTLVAASVLEAPASIAGSERFFSRLTQIISPQRSSLQKEFGGSVVLYSMRNRKHKISTTNRVTTVPPFRSYDANMLKLKELNVKDEGNPDDDYIENQEDVVEEVDLAVEVASDSDTDEENNCDDHMPPIVPEAAVPTIAPTSKKPRRR
jgi:hAT family C-terminal dimerisation region